MPFVVLINISLHSRLTLYSISNVAAQKFETRCHKRRTIEDVFFNPSVLILTIILIENNAAHMTALVIEIRIDFRRTLCEKKRRKKITSCAKETV